MEWLYHDNLTLIIKAIYIEWKKARIRYIAHILSKLKYALLFWIIDQVYAHYVLSNCQGMASLNT